MPVWMASLHGIQRRRPCDLSLYPRPVSVAKEHTGALGELPIFWRSAAAPSSDEDRAPVLYLHGVPTSSEDWVEFRERGEEKRRWWKRKRNQAPDREGFLERSGGLAPDLPGFGRSGKPGHFDYTIPGYVRFIEQYLDLVEVQRVRLVVHDWGVVGLAFAQQHPERIERLVVMNAVPLLPGYSWHQLARLWRKPVLGELAMGASTRPVLRWVTRDANATPGPMPDAWLESVLDSLDQGTQRAILRLYRSAPTEVLAQAGAELRLLDMPALVVWGLRDPYIPAHFAGEYARVLPNAELLELPDAGHWWWLDRPDAVEQVLSFLAGT